MAIASPVSADPFTDLLEPTFTQNCVKCHGKDGKVKGKVNLLELTSHADLTADPELIEELIDVLEFEEMPPEDEAPLAPETRRRLVEHLREMLKDALNSGKVSPQTPIRRMNRFQYNNAVQDLFDLKCVVFPLPERMMREHRNYFRPETGKMADTVTVGSRPLGKSQLIEPYLAGVAPFPQDLRAEHGYDNRADHLSLSPLLMESFLKLSRSITESPDFGPKTVGAWDAFFAPPKTKNDLETAVRDRLRPFLSRAFRRPVDDALLSRYSKFVMRELAAEVPFTDAMKAAAAATIASPKFLYLYDQAGTRQENSADLELASRLSFFLWGSIPDEELRRLAQAGTLHDPEVLAAQVDRMLRDHKVKRFCDSFPAQWLQLDRIVSSFPDRAAFPDFYIQKKFRVSMHMMLEPLLLFETILVEDLPITQLLDPDFTYRSTRLEEAYGLEPTAGLPKGNSVTTLNFNRLPVEDRRHGGVITNAAVMTMTSGPERTKPITRGAWLATVIFNDPPEPPPADVPPLDEKPGEGGKELTLRERLTAHRERADCAGCHEKIDPLGFALENYDAVGVWRDTYDNGRKVDMEGTLFRKHEFGDIVEFKDALLAEKDRFTRGFAGHLLSFALARELGPGDTFPLDAIASAVAKDDYRMHTLIKQIVLSEPFRNTAKPKNPQAK